MFNRKTEKKRSNEVSNTLTTRHVASAKIQNKDLPLLKQNQRCIVDKISTKIEETGFAAENLITITHNISQYVEVQMDSIEKVVNEISNYSALAEEVFASTENSKQIAEQTITIAKSGSKAVTNSIDAMNEIETSVSSVKEVINELNTKAAHIDEMLAIIKDIATHTNLLSLNASIEAARAGDAGKGFAVVAQEVKKLAQRSVESVSFISKTITEINQSIAHTMNAMDKTTQKVKEGAEIAKNTMEVFQNIVSAVETTTNVTEEINIALSKQTENLENVISSTEEMSHTSEKLLSIVESASLNTQYTKTSLETLSEVSENLKNISDTLLEEIETSSTINCMIRTCLSDVPLDFDPAFAFDQQSGQIIANIHSGLLSIGPSGEICPGIAKSWYVEEDNLTWIFNLRKGARFQNGREVTSSDVKYSYERLLSPSVKSPNSWFLVAIDGAQAYLDGKAREVSGIQILDKYRISIKLSIPYSGFLLNLGQYCCSILPREEVEKKKFVGCGAYILENHSKEGCTLTAFKGYYGGAPYVDKVFVQYSSKNIAEEFLDDRFDFITVENKSALERLKAAHKGEIKMKNVMGSYYAGFNLESTSPFARDKELRKVLNHAINRKRIITDILGGMAVESKGPFPPSIVNNAYLPSFDYNPGLVKNMFSQKGLRSPKLKVVAREESKDAIFSQITNYIIEDFKAVGIDVSVEYVARDKYSTPQTISRADLFISRWIADTGDADNFLQPMFNPINVTDFTRYNNPEVIEKMDRAKEIVNPQKRLAMYQEIQKMIIEDAPWIFLYHPLLGIAAKDNVLGMRINPLGIVKYEDILLRSTSDSAEEAAACTLSRD